MGNPLFARKPVELILAEMEGEQRLRRVLGPSALTSLGIGAIIGTGIFVLTGVAAHDKTGPALMLSFVVAGLACIFAALCYAEFAVDGAGRRLGLHLCLCDAGRAVRLDHRLGPDPGIRGRLGHRGARLVPLLSELHRPIRHAPARGARQSALRLRPDHGQAVGTDGIVDLPAVVVIVGSRRAGQRHPRERRLQRRDGPAQAGDRLVRDRRRRASTSTRPTGSRLRPYGYGGSQFFGTTIWGQTGNGGEPLGHARGRGDDLLRVHRLRFGLHPRRGGQEPAARRADRHHRLAGALHRALHRRRGGAHRHGAATTRSTSTRRSPSRSPPSACRGRSS